MQFERNIVIENRWTAWSPIVERSGDGAIAAQRAVLDAGSRIKSRLGLRADPFRFRGSGAEIEFQAVGLAGGLSLREISIEIVPKFVHDPERVPAWNTSTLFLLEALAGRHVISLLADRQEWKSHRVVDLIAHAFADAAERGLRDEPIHVYRQIEESAVALRGRLNLTRQLRNFVRAPHLLECDVDHLDVDNPLNDVLKWAASVLARAVREPALSARLEVLAETIPGRADRSQAYRHIRLIPPPQFQAWADALELARLLAGGMTLSSMGGHRSGYSLLFNMERAFERFVEYGLARTLQQLGKGELTSNRQAWTSYADPAFEGGKPLCCRPDNVVRRDGRPVLVVDAKYKVLDEALVDADSATASPASTDVYELMVGILAHGCNAGLLVYPSSSNASEGNSSVRTWIVNAYGTKVRIGAVPIHLLGLRSRVELAQALSKLGAQIAHFESATTSVSIG